MPVRHCLICAGEITATNDSAEHIVAQAIGGRRTIRGLICEPCNNRTGREWDVVLADQLQPLSLLFSVMRQRGAAPPLKMATTSGEALTVKAGGQLDLTKPEIVETVALDGSVTIQVKARTMKEARQILKGLKRKHPGIDVEAELANAEERERYAEGDFYHELTIGGEAAGRSIVKSCVAMAFASGVDWNSCGAAVSYLRDPDAPACFGYYSERDLVTGRPAGAPIHCVAVQADPQTGLVLAYLELFGCQRMVACLGEGYAGELVESVYAIDPRNGSRPTLTVDLSFGRTDIEEIFAYKRVDHDEVRKAIDAVIGPELARQAQTEWDRVRDTAVQEAFDTCGAQPGERLTAEHVRKISQSIARRVAPYILQARRPMKRDS